MTIADWIQAFRLRTLPLAVAAITLGACIAKFETGKFPVMVYVLALLTAFLLQILSNLANDYGDYKNGADGAERTDRAVASGRISEQAMYRALIICTLLCLVTGISLLIVSLEKLNILFLTYVIIGLAAIASAIRYTAGKNPYGYSGWGDIFVLVFFGYAAVAGVFYLIAHTLQSPVWWAASGMGLLCVGVLNINNIRDIETDAARGKRTIAVQLGYRNSLTYQGLLILGGTVLLLVYVFLNYHSVWQFSFVILYPLYFTGWLNVKKAKDRPAYNKQLKALSLLNLFTTLAFGLSQILSC